MFNYIKPIAAMMVIAAIIVLGIASESGVAQAQGPSGQYRSGIACLNLSQTATTASIDFYRTDGTKATTLVKPDPLAPNSPWLLVTTDITDLGSSFQGSAVVSSGQRTACSVNTETDPNAAIPQNGTGDGISADDAGPKIVATQIINDFAGFNSFVAVQNTSESATQVNATFFDRNGVQVHQESNVNIPGNASHTFYQDDGNFGSGFLGNAVFESVDGTTKLAGSVALYNDTTGQYYSFNTFSEGSDSVVLPRLSKNISGRGYTSGFSCANFGPGDANMEMTITMRNQETGTDVTGVLNSGSIAENTAWLVNLNDPTGTPIDAINRGFGGAIVTSTGGLIACTANEEVRDTPQLVEKNLVGQGSTYGGIPSGQATNVLFYPQIVALENLAIGGGWQFQNTTGDTANCTYEFSNGETEKSPVVVDPFGSVSIFAPDYLDDNAFNGSLQVTCDKPIVGIFNFTTIGPTKPGDPFRTNTGINISNN